MAKFFKRDPPRSEGWIGALVKNDSGAHALEYVILGAFVFLALAGAVVAFAGELGVLWGNAKDLILEALQGSN